MGLSERGGGGVTAGFLRGASSWEKTGGDGEGKMVAFGALLGWLLLGGTVMAADSVEEAELNETVVCTNDHMEVVIPAAFFLNKVPPVYVWDLHLNDPECRGVQVGDDYVFSVRTNLSDCGTITVSDDSHIMFMNTIHNNYSDIITRSYINITFVCRYPLSYMVQQPGGQNLIRVDVRSITLSTEDGNFSVSMLLFKDEAFQDRWTTVPALALDQDIFLPAHLLLRIQSCWATPDRDPFSNIRYTFIRDSCPLLEDLQTLRVLKNGDGADAAFRMQMFKFVGGSYTDVFLHCNVQICHGGPGACRPNCSSEDGFLRTRRDLPLSHTLTYGPIRRLRSETPDLDAAGVPPVETLVLGGLLGVLLLVTAALGRLWLRSRRFYPTLEAQLTLSNIHHLHEGAS
ncbi:pancreatic secretory granule membrane major glycoprotein GP2 isoform X2 [Oryzias latipes]